MVELYGCGPEMARVEDVELGAMRLRLLVPGERPRGVIVYYHGGGWVAREVVAAHGLPRD